MDLPKFHETFQPILDVLKDGKTLTTRELIAAVTNLYYSHLTPELLEQKTKSGENLLFNRIAWGKSYLKKGGFVSFSERGHVRITNEGVASLSSISLDKVVDKSNFLSFYIPEEQARKNNGTPVDIQADSPQDLIDRGFQLLENATNPSF